MQAGADSVSVLGVGAAVRVTGLMSDAFVDVNGRDGRIVLWDERNGRWKVRIQGRDKARTLLLHGQNLVSLSGASATAGCSMDGGDNLHEPSRLHAAQPEDDSYDDELWQAGFEPQDTHVPDKRPPIEKKSPQPLVIDRSVIPATALDGEFVGETLTSLAALGVQVISVRGV